MLQRLVTELNDENNLLINPEYEKNEGFIRKYIPLELESFEFLIIEQEIIKDMKFYRDIHKHYSSDPANAEARRNELCIKYKNVNCREDVLENVLSSIKKRSNVNYERRKRLCCFHFNRDISLYFPNDEIRDNITKMIDLCIEKNIEIEGINLLKYRDLRWPIVHAGVGFFFRYTYKDIEEIKL
jgi:hypothetical protein